MFHRSPDLIIKTCAGYTLLAQSVARLTLALKVEFEANCGRFSQPSVGGKMSTWRMIPICGIHAFQIGNQDMAAFVLYVPKGVYLRAGVSSS